MPRVRLPGVRVHAERQPGGPPLVPVRHAAATVAASLQDRCGDRRRPAVPAQDEARGFRAPRPQARKHPPRRRLRLQDRRRRAGAHHPAVNGRRRRDDAVPGDGGGGHLLLYRPGVPEDGARLHQVRRVRAGRHLPPDGHRQGAHGARLHRLRRAGGRHVRRRPRQQRGRLAGAGGPGVRRASAQVLRDAAQGPAGPGDRRDARADPVAPARLAVGVSFSFHGSTSSSFNK